MFRFPVRPDRSSTARVQQGSFVSFSAPSYILAQRSRQTVLHCAHRTSTALSCAFCEQKDGLVAPNPTLPSLLVSFYGGSLVDPRMRASNEALHRARFPRAGGRPGCPSLPFQARLYPSRMGADESSTARVQHMLILPSLLVFSPRGGLDCFPTAHVERPPFHRGGSVSKGK